MYTWPEIFFFAAFVSQIMLISFYVPRKILSRISYVFKNYPAEDYPKLYPKPMESYLLGRWAFHMANRVIFILGFVILGAMLFWVDHSSFADDGYISEAWPMGYGFIQFLPLIVLELSEFSQLRLMKRVNETSKRTAVLSRRNLFEFASPRLVTTAGTLICAAFMFDWYAYSSVPEVNSDTLQRMITLIGTNLFFAAMGAWQLYGKKPNPHLSSDDRSTQIGANLRSLLYISIAMSFFFIAATADDLYNLDYLDALKTSIYLQAITIVSVGSLLKAMNLKDMNFEVYKDADSAVR